MISLNGKASTKWKLGNTSREQILKTSIYEKGGRFLGAFNYYSNSFRYNKCDTVATYPETTILHMVADSINKVTLLNTNRQLFKQGTNYFDWIPIESNLWSSVFSVEMDRNGLIFLTTWDGDLFKSLDHGESWVKCNKPFPLYLYWFFFQVTSDGTLWASCWDNPLLFSRDGGITWTATNLPSNQQAIDAYYLSDGSFVILTNNTRVMGSGDGGLNWIDLNVTGYPLNLFVSSNGDVLVVTQENGITIKKSVDRGDHFLPVYSAYPESRGTMGHCFYKKGDTYYVMIQHIGVVTTTDFVNFKKFWDNKKIFDLFMDHRGTLIATKFDRSNAYYFAVNPN